MKCITAQFPQATIDEQIVQAENYFTNLMKSYGSFGIGGGSFDAQKHGVLQKAAIAYAVLTLAASAADSFKTIDNLYAIANIAYMEFIGCIGELQTPDLVMFLKRL